MSTMGQRIKKAREATGLLQTQLADAIDVKSAGVISNWEKDINKPNAERLISLCKVLNIELSYLLDYYGPEELPVSPQERTHLEKYRVLDEHGQGTVDVILDREYERCTKGAPPKEVDTELEAYRRELEAEQKGEISSVSDVIPYGAQVKRNA
ncbi:MAG: helix-turn-helix domain-containing protein [Syntrophomonadaceae bacterium]|jgi:transcriptional regulator with XRE-family HTH domain|nr:helix-turn-helix domain-containing protein [Syntrophomonadaceae bacterium]